MGYGTPPSREEEEWERRNYDKKRLFEAKAANQRRLLDSVGLSSTLFTDYSPNYEREWLEWGIPNSTDAEPRWVAAGFAQTGRTQDLCYGPDRERRLICIRFVDGTWHPSKKYTEEQTAAFRKQVRDTLDREATERRQEARKRMAAEAEAYRLEERRKAEERAAAEEKRRLEEIRKAEERALIERLDCASIVLGGSSAWDGGRLSLPTSDIDVFVTLSAEDAEKLRTTCCKAQSALLETFALARDTKRPINFVPSSDYHWALTGREAQQARVLQGNPIEFRPAPANAESSAVRRAAMRLMGVALCAPGPEVGPEHVLRQHDALENAIRWVEARAETWSDDTLRALAQRVREAIASGRDVREVL